MVKAGDVELWVERRGRTEVLLIAGLGDPAEGVAAGSKASPTAIASPPSTTAGRGARRCPRGRSRRRPWPTTPRRC